MVGAARARGRARSASSYVGGRYTDLLKTICTRMSLVNSSHFGSRSALPGLPLLERIATFYTHPLPQVRRALMDTMLQCIELSCNDELSAAASARPPAGHPGRPGSAWIWHTWIAFRPFSSLRIRILRLGAVVACVGVAFALAQVRPRLHLLRRVLHDARHAPVCNHHAAFGRARSAAC